VKYNKLDINYNKNKYITTVIFISILFFTENCYTQDIKDKNISEPKDFSEDVIIDNKSISNNTSSDINKDENKTVIINKNNSDFNEKEIKLIIDPNVDLNNIKSIMFTNKEMKKVEEAINARSRNVSIKKNIIHSRETQEMMIQDQSMLFLESILYISRSNWTIWISGHKIPSNNNSQSNEIYIKSINKERAKIKWSIGASKWKFLTENKNIDKSKYKINKRNNKIEVNVTLKTNQRFNLIDNKIYEGKLPRKKIEKNIIDKNIPKEEVEKDDIIKDDMKEEDVKKENITKEDVINLKDISSEYIKSLESINPDNL
jgi:hypothetical protein